MFSDGVSAEENDAQMSLSAAHATASASQGAAPSAAPSTAVGALVSRFTTPTGVHPPVVPSLGEAFANCKLATLAYVAKTAAVLIAAPETFGASFAVGALRIAGTSSALSSCIEQNENQQIQAGNLANQAADCRSEGATPLTTTDGVVCAK